MARRLASFVVGLAALLVPLPSAWAAPSPARPKLVVLISIDQFRADYLERFGDLFLPATGAEGVGGFRYLMERGAYHTDAHHDHYPLYTGPGHSILLTGAPPYKSGIVGNEWLDRASGKERYCVQDEGPRGALVGVGGAKAEAGISPATLRVTTVGDELKMATGGGSRVWSVALKDRAAVLMAGHLADGAIWFDDKGGRWIGSRHYFKDGKLPAWLDAWNDKENGWMRRLVAKDPAERLVWTLAIPEDRRKEVLARTWSPADNPRATPPKGMKKTFVNGEHGVDLAVAQPSDWATVYRTFERTPFANRLVFDTAEEIVGHERLGRARAPGRRATPDLLAINLSTNDYVGHAFGPDSAEVLDITVQTDRELARFFRFLARAVPGGLANVTIVLTADHGVGPIVADAQDAGLPGGSRGWKLDGMPSGFLTAFAKTLAGQRCDRKAEAPADEKESERTARLDEAKALSKSLLEVNYYLDLDALPRYSLDSRKVEAAAARAFECQPGIYAAYTRSQILEGRLPATDIGRRVARSFQPAVSGDVVLVEDPGWISDTASAATHGTPYTYDTSVPLLLAGSGIRPGRYTERVSTLDIAPTLSYLLGILQPSGCEGEVLSKAVR